MKYVKEVNELEKEHKELVKGKWFR